MRIFSIVSSLILLVSACQTTPTENTSAFVTLLGQDTLAVEVFTRTVDGMRADVVLRTPVVTRQTYLLTLDDMGHMTRLEAEIRPLQGDAPAERRLITRYDDGFAVSVTENGITRIDSVEAPAAALPFLDMIHWPFELMLERSQAAGALLEQPLLAGNNVMPFEVRRISPDSVTVRHPFRGTMGVDIDPAGQLVLLDASATTRKLRVHRRETVDIDRLATSFAAAEAAGKRFGELSGRAEAGAMIGGATLLVDYGQPLKRGRIIFGQLVPYGEVWRTGANRATHFRTDRGLRFGDLAVPAGEYTLFTIPAPGGGVLMINTQTGQGGTTYDPALDLGRVPLAVESLEQEVEPFTIALEPTAGGGVLKLMWDRTALVAPFSVQ